MDKRNIPVLARFRGWIQAAAALLTKGNSRMSDIAFDVGYQDSHYFSYLFKKHVGVSPREYRSRSEER